MRIPGGGGDLGHSNDFGGWERHQAGQLGGAKWGVRQREKTVLLERGGGGRLAGEAGGGCCGGENNATSSAMQTCCCMLLMRSRCRVLGTLWGSPEYKPWFGPKEACHWFSPKPAELCPSTPVTKLISQYHAKSNKHIVHD